MLEFSKRLGICLGIAAAFCLGACGDDDSSTDKGKSGGSSDGPVACANNDDCKDVDGKPVCDEEKKECVEEKKEDGGSGDGGSGDGGNGDGDGGSGDGGSSDGDGGSGDGGSGEASCPEGQKLCGSTCRDTTKENEHCGDCDSPCTDGKTCVDSKCEYVCDESKPDKADDGCYNYMTDNDHCGSYTNKCTDGKVCNNGTCIKTCEEASEIACGADDTCINPLSNDAHCGKCDNPCDSSKNETCQGGVCQKSCPAGHELCGTECIVLDSDTSCGTCNEHPACDTANHFHCSTDHVCKTACTDSDGNLQFVDLKSSKDYCGSCDGEHHACGEDEVCNDGVCVGSCGADKVEYGGTCVSKNDPTHCGIGSRDDSIPEGGIDCTALEGVVEATCENEKCKIASCAENYAVCESNPTVCTDLRKPEACGSCTNVCEDSNAIPDKTTCQVNTEQLDASECHFECKEGMSSCGGACKDLQNDDLNCGWCGNKCEGSAKCKEGFCVIDKCEPDSEGYLYADLTVAGKSVKAFCVRTADEMVSISAAINNGGGYPLETTNKNFILASKIDFGTRNWTPIGTASNSYKGYFLGNGKQVTGKLTISGNVYAGLFGKVENSQLEGWNLDLTMEGTVNYSMGTLAGHITSSVVKNSKLKGTIVNKGTSTNSGLNRLGGLVGRAESSTISNADTDVSVTFNSYGGAGLVGYILSSEVNQCSSNATIIAGSSSIVDAAGGLVGVSYNSSIKNSHATGTLKLGTYSFNGLGGLLGWMSASTTNTVENSWADVTIEAEKVTRVGGLVGNMADNSTGTIINSYAKVVSKCSSYCGGLVGNVSNKATITKCNSSGSQTSGSYGGGLIGYITGGKVEDSNANVEMRTYGFDPKITKNTDSDGKGYNQRGGLIGVSTNVEIKNCQVHGDIDGNYYIGGVVGQIAGGSMENVAGYGNVRCTWSRCGGIVGTDSGTTLDNVAYFGSVTSGQGWRGGIVGMHYGTGELKITNAYYVGSISANNNGSVIGGIVGGACQGAITLKNVYIYGSFKTTGDKGALMANFNSCNGSEASSNPVSVIIKNSYYLSGIASKAVTGTAKEVSAYKYTFNDSGEAVLEDSRKVAEALGTNWTTAKATFNQLDSSAPGVPVAKEVTYELPALKSLNNALFIPDEE